jgi:ParB family chromosome partitioning protein
VLVYGYRRLVAIQQSHKVDKVRALIANLDDRAAQQAQISENMARRDLSYIEKALLAKQLVEGGFGSQTEVAEVLTVTKSSISMAFAILDLVGEDLVRAIGPAHGIGRPRWDALAKGIADLSLPGDALIDIAARTYDETRWSDVLGEDPPAPQDDPSLAAFEAVFDHVQSRIAAQGRAQQPPEPAKRAAAPARRLRLDGQQAGTIRRTPRGLRVDIDEGAFADWLDGQAESLLSDLYARWQKRAEDPEQ